MPAALEALDALSGGTMIITGRATATYLMLVWATGGRQGAPKVCQRQASWRGAVSAGRGRCSYHKARHGCCPLAMSNGGRGGGVQLTGTLRRRERGQHGGIGLEVDPLSFPLDDYLKAFPQLQHYKLGICDNVPDASSPTLDDED